MDRFVVKKQKLIATNEKLKALEEEHDEKEPKTEAPLIWRKITAEKLDCDYLLLYNKSEADKLLRECEETLTYNSGRLAQVQVFGKWHDIPRKQVAHGNEGLHYTFSGNTVPARPWTPLLLKIKERIMQVTGHSFNFVLINRYKDGNDHMGEHRDDEKDLVRLSPIASLSLGQARDFVFRHECARGSQSKKGAPKLDLDPIKIELQHGSLLMMNYPTNVYWYHSLPQRKRLPAVRINMTFRDMVIK
ncbi:DNA oxidative demethylase ALKBH2-like [Octopus vulgaris]|uniref:DNA oxidative demethylase ALKBH2 n=1 Tax=Octopus vulgaris TaxID=6645 RepID=A0AA36BVE3_OCTVU|nr:DNA oxidative demethylase ALKBH2-like [Octopus vulgaris]